MPNRDAQAIADRAVSDAVRAALQNPGLATVDRLALILTDPYGYEQPGYGRICELLDLARQRKAKAERGF
jgi:hypothetical protein